MLIFAVMGLYVRIFVLVVTVAACQAFLRRFCGEFYSPRNPFFRFSREFRPSLRVLPVNEACCVTSVGRTVGRKTDELRNLQAERPPASGRTSKRIYS